MQNFLISVVVPVYNIKDYLVECVESVLNQKYEIPREIILVDDGSTDGSSEICDYLGKKYDSVEIIHQTNKGLSSARNAGIEICRGKYVIFLDGDDYWKNDFTEAIYDALSKTPDIILFGAKKFINNVILETIESKYLPLGEQGKTYLSKMFSSNYAIQPYAWLYAYKRTFLLENKLRFIDGQHSSEDYEFNMNCLSLCNSIIGVDRLIYMYRIRNNSLTSSISKEKILANLISKEKYFRLYPCSVTADIWAWHAVQIGKLEKKDEIYEISKEIKNNDDIFAYVSNWKYKLSKRMYKLFGYYYGAKLCLFINGLFF